MNEVQRGVYDFHSKYGCMVQDQPTMPSAGVRLLRARLIVEEAGEFLKAASNGDMVEMCDALADLLYVTYGTAVVMGVDMEPISAEVQRSNMTKDGGGQDSGGKILKGPDFTPPDIDECLHKQGWRDSSTPPTRGGDCSSSRRLRA